MPPHLLVHLVKFSPVAGGLAAIGGWLWHPDCVPTVTSSFATSQKCSNAWGDVSAADMVDGGFGLVLRGVGYGAILGVAIVLVLVYVVGVSKKDVGME